MDFLTKLADLKDDVELRPHQRRAVNKIKDTGSLNVAHGTGTGKTLTGIAAIEEMRQKGDKKKTLVVVPASLKTNFAKHGVNKFTDSSVQVIDSGSEEVDPDKDYYVVSQTLFSRNPEKYSKYADSLIVDEAHNMRNQTTKLNKAVENVAPKFNNRVMLTASPINNAPGDLASLINTAKGEREYDQTQFNKDYVKDVKKGVGFLGKLGLTKKQKVDEKFDPDEKLKQDLQKYFDYEEGKQDLPDTEEKLEKVPMEGEQLKAYRYAWNQMPRRVRRAVKKDIMPSKRDNVSFFGAIANARVASNNPASLLKKYENKPKKGWKVSAKARKLLDDLGDVNEKELGSMIYSNYNQHGADVIQNALDSKGISSSRISGGMRKKDKDKEIEDFKKGKTDAFVTSPTGKEGISLPNVDQEYIFDPNWNPEVTRQAIGRGVRADSKADKVDIKKYLAVEPEKKILGLFKKKPNRSVEEWINSVAQKKKKLQNQVYGHMGGNNMNKEAVMELGMEKIADLYDRDYVRNKKFNFNDTEPIKNKVERKLNEIGRERLEQVVGTGIGGKLGYNLGNKLDWKNLDEDTGERPAGGRVLGTLLGSGAGFGATKYIQNNW